MTNQIMNNELWVYDQSKMILLNPKGNYISPRSGCKLCSSNGEDCIYLYGGYNSQEGDFFNDLYRYDLPANRIE